MLIQVAPREGSVPKTATVKTVIDIHLHNGNEQIPAAVHQVPTLPCETICCPEVVLVRFASMR